MVNILSNGVDFLSIARAPYSNNGIGLSANARRLTDEFLTSGTTLFNSLIFAAEDEQANLVTEINALRSRLGIETFNPNSEAEAAAADTSSETDSVPVSQTLGTEVDTAA